MAQNDLIILTFEERENAMWALRALEMMRGQHAFGLDCALHITRDRSGKTILHQSTVLTAYPHAPHHRVPNLLCNAIFSSRDDDHFRQLAQLGLDEFFLQRVTQALVPNSSAILIYVPSDDNLIDLQALLSAISLLSATLHRTSIPERIEQSLLNYIKEL